MTPFHCHPLVNLKAPFQPQISPKLRFRTRMKFTKKKLILVLVFVFSCASILRFLKISMTIYKSSSALPPFHHHQCSTTSSTCSNNISPDANNSLTNKEMQFLLKFLSHSVPCNLLVFGNKHNHSTIASLNSNGLTVFLEDHLQKKSKTKSANNNTQVHNIKYHTVASEAYQLLKDARKNPHCSPNFYELSKCNLALANLPWEVYDTTWDVVMVDGPSGDTPDSPGRMASIYTAGVLARRGNETHVIVHDVDRMIENWFSWEFLCEENLVSSKGRFRHFQVLGVGVTNATTFCTR